MHVDQLLESISALAGMLDLQASVSRPARGRVIETGTRKGLGTVATLLIQEGTLDTGSTVVSAHATAKVRCLSSTTGEPVQRAGPSDPVVLAGWRAQPAVGNEFYACSDEKLARMFAEAAKCESERQIQRTTDTLVAARRETERRLRRAERASAHESDRPTEAPKKAFIFKYDVVGSGEAILGVVKQIRSPKISPKVVGHSVGQVTDADIQMAKVANADIVVFNVPVSEEEVKMARRRGVSVHKCNVIYELCDLVREILVAQLPPIASLENVGTASVKRVFEIKVPGGTEKVAGCEVTSGQIVRGSAHSVRVERGGVSVHEGAIRALRHVKRDVASAQKGMECGIAFEDFGGVQVDDTIYCIKAVKTKQTLE